MDEKLIEKLRKEEGLIILTDELMRYHTTLRTGGSVSAFIHVKTVEALKRLIYLIKNSGIRFIIIGGGSNIVWPDRDMDIAVIYLSGLRDLRRIDQTSVVAQAGAPLSRLVRFTVQEGLQGFEGLLGIPGTVGGAVKGNAGAFGCEIKDKLRLVRLLTTDGVLKELKREDIHFSYRNSSIGDREIILEAEFSFKIDAVEELEKRMRDYLQKRRQTQPLGLPSAGSVFKNPPGDFAGRLIEQAGCKGMRSGDMEVSMIHANFIVNRGRGTQKDFLNLVERVQERVMKKFNLFLEPEVKIIRQECECEA
ncbi:MAG: UDP-N-acetylmuramate dehydrogenase [Thermodesulfovibrionales bacterium]|nr:UDP-N-acetylmuramate dehydrogenase [Thermodesulfovibrionales bacterium]